MISGLRLDGKKDTTLLTWIIRRPRPPEKVHLLLEQAPKHTSLPCVSVGSKVQIGQKIAEPEGPGGVGLHGSLSGYVEQITSIPNPFGGESLAIEIKGDGNSRLVPGVGMARSGWEGLSSDETLCIFQDSGLVITDHNTEPLHVRVKKHKNVSGHTLVVNGCESEPYVTSEHALMMSHPLEILKGAEILRKTSGASKVIFAIENNKLEVIELIKSKIYFLKWDHFEVRTLPSIYPQGSESALTYSLFPHKKKGKRIELADRLMIIPALTVFTVYEAVALQKPFYERPVTVGGECVVEPKNLWLPLGISFKKAIQACRGLLREPRKVVMGGPMAGKAQAGLEASVVKSTEAILALPKEIAVAGHVEPCIRCHLCGEACPVSLSPAVVTRASEQGEFELAREWGAGECIECGNCAYVCPAKRPMLELIRLANTPKHLRSV